MAPPECSDQPTKQTVIDGNPLNPFPKPLPQGLLPHCRLRARPVVGSTMIVDILTLLDLCGDATPTKSTGEHPDEGKIPFGLLGPIGLVERLLRLHPKVGGDDRRM